MGTRALLRSPELCYRVACTRTHAQVLSALNRTASKEGRANVMPSVEHISLPPLLLPPSSPFPPPLPRCLPLQRRAETRDARVCLGSTPCFLSSCSSSLTNMGRPPALPAVCRVITGDAAPASAAMDIESPPPSASPPSSELLAPARPPPPAIEIPLSVPLWTPLVTFVSPERTHHTFAVHSAAWADEAWARAEFDGCGGSEESDDGEHKKEAEDEADEEEEV